MFALFRTHKLPPGAARWTALPGSVLALVLLALVALPVLAQSDPPQLATWDVQVWPEYDRPSVLVIASGVLDENQTFPFQVRAPLPPDATVHAVAYPGPAGNLLTLPWRIERDAAGQSVVFAVDQPRFVIEYYADILTQPPSRRFELPLVAPYAVQQASLALRQPSRASDLQVTPAMNDGGPDSLGNPTYTLDLGPLEAGQSVPMQVSYSKADDDPSVDSTPVAAASAPAPVVADSEQVWLPWVAGLLAAVLAGALAIYLVRRRRYEKASRQARRRDARKKAVQPIRQPAGSPPPTDSPNTFCVQCGHKFEGADKFCRNCGAQRR